MRVAFDAVMLSIFLHPQAKLPRAIDRGRERIQQLVADLAASDSKIVLPAPILAEFLVLAADDGPAYLSELTNSGVFEIQPFDTRAAVESASEVRKSLSSGDKKAGAAGTWQKVKVDRQCVAIAKVHDVDVLYSDDDDVRKLAAASGIPTKGLADLPVPPASPESGRLFPDTSTGAEQD